MPTMREIEIKKLLYEKNKLIKETKKQIKKLRLELNVIEGRGKHGIVDKKSR